MSMSCSSQVIRSAKLLLKSARKLYSETVIDHWRSPHHFGPISGAHAYARESAETGESVEVWLRMDGNRIAEASFVCDGCIGSVACGSMAVKLIENRTVDQATGINPRRIIRALGGIRPEEHHLADLVVRTLHKAIRNYREDRQHPWKTLYY